MVRNKHIALGMTVACGTILALSPTVSASPKPSWQQAVSSHHAVVDGQPVNWVSINVHNPHVSVRPVVANNTFGTTSSLASMANSVGAIAAINGTFFNSWSNRFPTGAIEINGQFQNDSQGTILGIGQKGQLVMTRAKESLSVEVHDDTNPISQLWPWYLNVPSTNSDRVSVLTSYFGKTTKDKTANVVTVQHNTVQGIHKGVTPIPVGGYAVEIGSGSASLLDRIHVGDPVNFSVSVQSLDGHSIDFSQYPNAIGAGPMIVDNKQIVLNPKLEGFTDPVLLNTNTLRSFVGIDSSGNLILGTIHSATLSTEAKIAHSLGLKQAMNLDGGSSTGLYFNGTYVTRPGRNLATALVVSYK
ncbi:phosphodiester glycosidase family protein [Alicyclobacillus dauci]|uniref:Phosphodiester glycosidase family protein n=1 Tax=Alicyclobacillus dauci TaxID=1475485 RepID=A0ABY6YZG0_9BACL|nr:phosphodiester glycosidase family protein [Alicyclobacillus dauci]WAH35971.1 phosphodiester glycosidase family protein [Alicyclobacillus dauci]